MKLTPHGQTFIYELLALGTRPCVIIDKVNKRYGGKSIPFKSNSLAFYQNKWTAMTPAEQKQHLPYTMEDSFAVQDVRINDDIKQMELINHRIAVEEGKEKPDNQTLIELVNTGVRVKNRIAQELGQVRAFTKGGIGNINILQMQLNKFENVVSRISELKPEERIKLLETVGEIEERGENK